MKMIILVACALVAIAAAAPVEDVHVPQVIVSRYDPQPDGGYVSSFETENGIKRYETGVIREVVNEEGERVRVLIVSGSSSYVDPEGHVQSIEYNADEAGFSAIGDSIPQVPVARR